MNRKTFLRSRASWLLLIAAIVGACAIVHSTHAPTQQPTDEEIYLATAPARAVYNEEISRVSDDVAFSGYERGTAGFYLLRPVGDPLWAPQYNMFLQSGGFHWYFAQRYYQNLEYQHFLPPGYTLAGGAINSSDPMISLSRILANRIATVAVVPETSGTFSVQATFDAKGMEALQRLIADNIVVAGVEYTDWFGVTHPPGVAPTEMRIVAVSNDFAYLPFSIHEILARRASPVSVAVATGLSSDAATSLASRLSGP